MYSISSVTPFLAALVPILSCLALRNRNPHTIASESQTRPSSNRQLLPGGYRGTSTRSQATQGSTGTMLPHSSNGTTDSCTSHDSQKFSNTLQPARNQNESIASRRAYQHYTARTSRDDPFFSEELYRGMLNGKPDNAHVGSMYTSSKQQEIDAYYRRLMAPRPEQQRKPSPPPTPPPRLRMEAGTYWNPEWSNWVNVDDAEPLVQTQHQGDDSPESPSVSPP